MKLEKWFLPIICAAIITAIVNIFMMEYRLRKIHGNQFSWHVSIKTILLGFIVSIMVYLFIYGLTLLVPMGPLV